ncbi:GNAT family N-acetyltransferase [Halalkalibacter urbisdiaboli]|uniref:GNAT family N-acetyltransferase n=1 Tax=Halalkalibacter urbisdiaboli TaxID=1960589 RepID=UPI000B43A96D|nr:GNAT family N-acetyltransferase [Halalkalibacter urbisdiaboli]
MPNIKNAEFPELETERVNLRILTFDNSEEVYLHFSDNDVTRYMDIEPCKHIKEAEEIIRFHMEDSGCRWGLFHKHSNKFIGTVGFHYLRRKNEEFIAEVGFDLSKAYWGNGFMYEAMKEVILFGFTQMGLTTIDATVELDNEKSINLMKKLGFNKGLELKGNLQYFYLNSEDKEVSVNPKSNCIQ